MVYGCHILLGDIVETMMAGLGMENGGSLTGKTKKRGKSEEEQKNRDSLGSEYDYQH